MTSPLNKKLDQVEWGEFSFKSLFNNIKQGRRLKKEDQLPGDIPFVMSGVTNSGVVSYIRNPVARFPKNAITVDIFGNVFYRNYEFGAGDDTGVYWNDEITYSANTMLFFASAMSKSLEKKFSYGNKLRSSQSYDFTIRLPVKNNHIDFEFINSFVAELEAERVAELEAYLTVTGLKDYELTEKERLALENLNTTIFKEFNVLDIFNVKNTSNLLSRDIIENSGITPYLCASAENNAVSSYISYDETFLNEGNCVFIGGKTFVVTYQKQDFFSNDSHNLALYLRKQHPTNENVFLGLVTCVNRSLKHKYSWGDSVSSKKIKSDVIMLPVKNDKPDFDTMETLISAVKKLVIKNVVEYANNKIKATKQAIAR